MKKLILLFLFLTTQNFVFGQEDENSATIIFNDSTTVKGYGEIKKNKIYFKLTPNEEPSEWSYDIAKGIIFSGYGYSEKYEYIVPDKSSEPTLMEVVEEGNVNLYRKNKIKMSSIIDIYTLSNPNSLFDQAMKSKTPHSELSSVYYVKKEYEEYPTNISLSFKSRSLKYFSDCEIIIEKINEREFKADNITEMVTYYNNYCDNNEN